MRYMNLLPLFLAISLAACGPNESQKREIAEKKRIECLDKFCDGDVEPTRNMATEVAYKLYGQWYLVPKQYAKGMSGLAFYWPSKTPVTGLPVGQEFSEKGRDYYDVAIEIFLTGRQRWPDPNVVRPWDGESWELRLEELQRQGLRIQREKLRPDLERIRFFDTKGQQYRHEYYLAAQQRKIRGNGIPGIACDLPDSRPKALPRCNGGFFWQEDVYADFRFHAQHAADWPAIHQEIVRVLNLAKKAQP